MEVREFLGRDDFEFIKKDVLDTIEGCLSSTSVDAHNQKITLGALRDMRKQAENIPWMTLEHTSRCPVGIIKTDSLEIIKLKNGEYGLYSKMDIIDQRTKDKLDSGELGGFSVGITIIDSDGVDKKDE